MKRFLFTIFLLGALSPLAAQLYHPGEQLFYRVSYKAKMFPNTEVGTVEVKTSEDTADGKSYYKVEGAGRTLPTYRWFFNLEDVYTVWIDTASLRPVRFESDIREGDYTFQSYYTYLWPDSTIHTRWRSRKNPFSEKQMALTAESMDPIALFFNLRSAQAENFRVGEPATLQMVLQDTIATCTTATWGTKTEDPQHGAFPHAQVRVPVRDDRRLLVHRRHDLHDLDFGRRQQNPPLHRIAGPKSAASTPTFRATRDLNTRCRA